MRCALNVSGEIPPTVVNESSPFSSMFVTATPTSSMCPTSAIVAASLCADADAGERRAERVRRHIGERRGGVAPDARRLLLVAGWAASFEECLQEIGGLHTLEHSSRSA